MLPSRGKGTLGDPSCARRQCSPARLSHAGAGRLSHQPLLHVIFDDSKLSRTRSVRHRLLSIMIDTLLLLALNGLVWGLIIALIALGLSVIFGLLDIINIAHGDFFMVGTVLAWFSLSVTGNFWIGFIVAPLIGFIIGAVIQRLVIQPIHGAAALSIVATFGLSLILQETARITFGATPRRMLAPIQGTVPLFGVDYEIYRLFA